MRVLNFYVELVFAIKFDNLGSAVASGTLKRWLRLESLVRPRVESNFETDSSLLAFDLKVGGLVL